MKKFITTLVLMAVLVTGFSQAGKLVLDSTRAKSDTAYFENLVYVSHGQIFVDTTGFVIQVNCPKVFVDEKGARAETNQRGTLKETIYIAGGKKEIDTKYIIHYEIRDLPPPKKKVTGAK